MGRVFVFGEVLFDIYENSRVIGGAPFNFCAHLGQLKHPTSLISAIGSDTLGLNVKENFKKFNIDASYLNTVGFPTGICRVLLSEDNRPCYDLCENQAYDNICLSDSQLSRLNSESDKYLYFGTLAQRNEVSRDTLKKIIETCEFDEIFYDINIRQNYYDKEILEYGLSRSTLLKFSREEAYIFKLLGIDFDNLDVLCGKLAERYGNLKNILLTLDKDGAKAYNVKKDKLVYLKAAERQTVSTVGAGDSFFAGYVHGMLKNMSQEECLKNAVELSAYVVGRLAAVPEYDKNLKEKLYV